MRLLLLPLLLLGALWGADKTPLVPSSTGSPQILQPSDRLRIPFTGPFYHAIQGTATANRVITLPDADVVMAGSAAALTSGRLPLVTTGGLLTDSALFTYSGTANPTITLSGTANGRFATDGASGSNGGIQFLVGGLSRWFIYRSSTVESGGNVGSDLQFTARADDGSAIDTALTLARVASGAVTLGSGRPFVLSGNITQTGATTLATGTGIGTYSHTTETHLGNVLVSQTATAQAFRAAASNITPTLQANGTTTSNAAIGISRWAAAAGGGSLTLAKSRSATIGSFTVVSSGDTLGSVVWDGDDGVQMREAASMRVTVDGTPGSVDMPGKWWLATTADGSGVTTDRLSVDAAGQVAVLATTDATSNTTGTITTLGGISWPAAKSAYGGLLNLASNLTLSVAGAGLYIKEGTNATSGAATLVAGTVTVPTTKVTANSRIHLSVQSLGTVVVPTAIAVTARVAGTSFTITSAGVTDTSVVAWVIVEPAP